MQEGFPTWKDVSVHYMHMESDDLYGVTSNKDDYEMTNAGGTKKRRIIKQRPKSCLTVWSAKALLKFWRPCKCRFQKGNPSVSRCDRKSLEDAPTQNEEEEEVTESETDEGSDDSHSDKPLLKICDASSHVGQDEPAILELHSGSFGLLDLNSSDLTFPSEDDDGGDYSDSLFCHRDNVHLLRDSDSHSVLDCILNYEDAFWRRELDDDEIALLSACEDAEDRHISYNVDTIDSSIAGIPENLTLLSLQRTAFEGETLFNPDQEPIIVPYGTASPPSRPPMIRDPGPPPVWSYELNRRLEIQKAFQLRLSYGGRNTKLPVKDYPHGELWTVNEEDESMDDSY